MQPALIALGLAACLAGGCSCNGSARQQASDAGVAPDDAAVDAGRPPLMLEPVWQVTTKTPELYAVLPGKGGVIVIGNPELGLYDPFGSVIATAPMPTTAPGDYVLFHVAQSTIDGAFDMLVETHQSLNLFVSEQGAALEQDEMVDTALPCPDFTLLADGSRSFVLARDGYGNLTLAEVQAGVLVSKRAVTLPQGQTFRPYFDPNVVASDGTLLFAGTAADNGASGIHILRVNPDDASATVLVVPLDGNESRPISMLQAGEEIILTATDFDADPPAPTEAYLTAFALNDLGTEVVRPPVRVERNDFKQAIRGFTVLDKRVVGLQPHSGFRLVSFDLESFAPQPDIQLDIPDGYFGGPFLYGMAQVEGALYAAMSIQNGVTAYTILQRLPPLEQATRHPSRPAPAPIRH